VPVVSDPADLESVAVNRENVGRLSAFFARRCRDPQMVADLTSQTFVEAITSAHNYRAQSTPTAWLFAIVRRPAFSESQPTRCGCASRR
jgi:DNA-directed RNA polymerase specialized sigma24 family protein